DPVLIRIGIFEIRYYGVVYAISFLLLYLYLNLLAKQKKIKLNEEEISELVVYLIIGVVFGARIFYVLFYNLKFYSHNILDIFMLWKGGMSFHGGLIGATIAAFAFCRKNKINFYEIADNIAIPACVFLMLGRIGNFINGELYGRVTEWWWAVKFKGVEGFRHPSQIYESFKNLIIFSILWFFKDKKKRDGFLFWLFIALYGLLRFFVEFFREPDEQLGFIVFNLSMGQLLSIVMFLIGAAMFIKLNNKNNLKNTN
ncbi:MAG: prolipoprotein diacylglyceryl transferase, partial [Candidatus Woesearchaeota archaeon]